MNKYSRQQWKLGWYNLKPIWYKRRVKPNSFTNQKKHGWETLMQLPDANLSREVCLVPHCNTLENQRLGIVALHELPALRRLYFHRQQSWSKIPWGSGTTWIAMAIFYLLYLSIVWAWAWRQKEAWGGYRWVDLLGTRVATPASTKKTAKLYRDGHMKFGILLRAWIAKVALNMMPSNILWIQALEHSWKICWCFLK